MADFQECMPILWHENWQNLCEVDRKDSRNIRSLLPPAIRNGCWAHPSVSKFRDQMCEGLLDAQEKKFQKDFDTVRNVFPSRARDTYLYYWLVVNTRSFYFELPGAKATKPKEDHMVLCPFADFFNHADHGVSSVW